MKLNLGCGSKILDGYVNIDQNCGDIKFDLSKKWPLDDDSADEILMDHVLEHLNLEHVYQEVWRVLKNNGIWDVWVPHCNSPYRCSLGHVRDYSLWTFKQIETEISWYFPHIKFHTELLRLEYRGINKLKWLNPIANISPFVWEFIGLPTFEIHYVGRKEL